MPVEKGREPMPTPIRIEVDEISLRGELNDSPCAEAVAAILPITATPSTWGDEFYFEIGLDHPEEEGACAEVQVGEIGYWPPGRAMAIFFGPTPASRDEKPVAASPVNRIGRILDDATVLRRHLSARAIRITREPG
jgi:hypothetical protein